MRNLLLLLLKNSSFLLFLMLELVCAFLVINYNEKQNEIFLTSSNFFAGIFYNKYYSVREYINLDEVADSLAYENAFLRSELANSRYLDITFRDTTYVMHVDSFGRDSLLYRYSYIPADVINNSVATTHNYFTLNLGDNHGIKKGMGVVTRTGLAGVVKGTSKRFSRVLSILNRDARISSQILLQNGKKVLGSAKWGGIDSRYMEMDDVPRFADVAVGDSVVTSGYSTIFPQDYPIGKVDTFFSPAGSNFYWLRVELFNDFNDLRKVYVVNDLFEDEIKELEATYE